MKRLLIASNRLPMSLTRHHGSFTIIPDGRSTVYELTDLKEEYDIKWIGQTGQDNYEFSEREKEKLREDYLEYRSIPVFPDPDIIQNAVHGFSKSTLWPLFHYFPQNASYNNAYWEAYIRINQLYADLLCDIAAEDDIIWVHDYHLLLVPLMIRKCRPSISIGLFIHIPFPSFEIFRLLPWREEIIDSMLSADLVGFNIFDYVRHFLSCVRRIRGYDTVFNRISIGERTLMADTFPKGINFEKFTCELKQLKELQPKETYDIRNQLIGNSLKERGGKIILSIDTLDYTKGIPHRLLAFEMFLQRYPEYTGLVSLVMLALPTGEKSRSHKDIKKQVDELVGRINGQYSTIGWTPVIYLNRKFSQSELIEIYALSDIALILPLRDGMNMVAKEFVASRLDNRGVLILSELAGASKELHEAIIVNPNNLSEIAESIKEAVEMPAPEQERRIGVMIYRIKRYTIRKWAEEFLSRIETVKELQQTNLTKKINEARLNPIIKKYRQAKNRILFLDYDGTLSGFRKDPEDAKPDERLYSILDKLTDDPANMVVIISGRDKETLGRWFRRNSRIHFIAEHGVWLREAGKEWQMMEQINNDWQSSVYPVLEYYVDQTPNTFIEKKNFSLVWHYRKADPDLGIQRSWELREQLRMLTANLNLEIMDGDKVIEIKYSGINKGRAALNKIGNNNYDFMLAIGDDWTDEYTFGALPESAYTIKVGTKTTKASFYIESVIQVRNLLELLCD